MSLRSWPKSMAVLAVGAMFLAALAAALPHVANRNTPPPVVSVLAPQETAVMLDPRVPDTLRLPRHVAEALGVSSVQAQPAPPPPPLRLDGSLFLDPNRLTHVHTRFGGEVVEIGLLAPGQEAAPGDSRPARALRYGDAVRQGQLLCVVWSKDLGEKKSELVDALSRLRLDQETQQRLAELYKNGAVPERSLREQERIVESDLIAVARAERTLRSWRLGEADLQEIRLEAERIHQGKGQSDQRMRETWARVEVRAALDGVVVEKNIAVGDVVDTTLDLFKIANLSRLDVLAHAYEEDLPLLESLPPAQRQWTIHLKSDPQGMPLRGSFDQIGSIIDPNQHTALVMGWVDNLDGRLRVGQFVTATIELPAHSHETAVPVSAVVDDGAATYVFVQPDPTDRRYTRIRVRPLRRRDDPALGSLVYLSARLSPTQLAAGMQPLKPGEWVVASGSIELGAKLRELAAEALVERREP